MNWREDDIRDLRVALNALKRPFLLRRSDHGALCGKVVKRSEKALGALPERNHGPGKPPLRFAKCTGDMSQ